MRTISAVVAVNALNGKVGEVGMTITLTDEEATLLCGLIEDEQNCCGYEQYWTAEQRETFDEIVYKLKCGFGN